MKKVGTTEPSQRLSIARPCPASDAHLAPSANGMRCDLCDHEVVDATAMTERQLIDLHDRTGRVCIAARVDANTGRLLVKREPAVLVQRRLPLLGALGAAALVACAAEPASPPRAPQDLSGAMRPDAPNGLPPLPSSPAQAQPTAPRPTPPPTPAPTAAGKGSYPPANDAVHVKGQMVVDPAKQNQREEML